MARSKTIPLLTLALSFCCSFLVAQNMASYERGDFNKDGLRDSLWFVNSWDNFQLTWEAKIWDGGGKMHSVFAHDHEGKLVTFVPIPKSLDKSGNEGFVKVILEHFAGTDYQTHIPSGLKWLMNSWRDGPTEFDERPLQYGFRGLDEWEYYPGDWTGESFKPAVIELNKDSIELFSELIFPVKTMRGKIPYDYDRGYLVYHGDLHIHDGYSGFPNQTIVSGNSKMYRSAQGIFEVKGDSLRWLFVDDFLYYYSSPLKRAYSIGLTEWGKRYVAVSFFRPRGRAYNLAIIDHKTGKAAWFDNGLVNQSPPSFRFEKDKLQFSTYDMKKYEKEITYEKLKSTFDQIR